METFDYVVVGAGSAGCAVAHRLSEDGKHRVLLLEAGRRDTHPFVPIPFMTRLLFTMKSLNWGYETAPEEGLGGRQVHWPRGKLLGGSSSINGMTFVRGHPSDFDRWRQMGAEGWSYGEVLPYFKKMEAHATKRSPFRGSQGPLQVTQARRDGALNEAFLAAGEHAGFPKTEDFNGASQEGFGIHDFTIAHARRQSAATAYLKPARGRTNLLVETNADVRRIVFDGHRATGVEFVQGGYTRAVSARREVIVCAGAVNSPALLMHSGIGPAGPLIKLGISVIKDAPEVGANLQDHLGAYTSFHCLQPVSLNYLMRPDNAVKAFLKAVLLRRGPGAEIPIQGCAFLKTRPDLEAPDVQITLVPGLLNRIVAWKPSHGFLIHVYQLRPGSRGEISLVSPNPTDKPRISANYLADPEDLVTLRRGVRLARKIAAQSSFDPYRGQEIAPGQEIERDDDLDAWIRANATTAYHPVGTCRMGDDEHSVVDPQLGVRGVEGLRVADASVMPAITSGNTNAPTIMIGEKAADLILGRAPLPRQILEVGGG
ncbi:MAG: choline dehydrogenase [Proteobacteria bacterium]|nr:choline dehydrogenase [Pseudomonadota bacterium]MDA1059435.1 choline dehydrogenase [Pseudomonadota bacterium]